MAIKTLINGAAADLLCVQDRGLQYGDGLFETIAVYDRTPLCLDAHLARLEQGCRRLMIASPKRQVLEAEVLSLANLKDRAVIKIIVTRGYGARGYATKSDAPPTRIVALYDWATHLSENRAGITARFCEYRYSTNPRLAGIKHLNRLEQVLARAEWDDPTIAEGIVLDDNDCVIEGTMSNLFYVKDNRLFTPDLSNCGIDGIVRQKIQELSPHLAVSCFVEKVSTKALLAADEIFLCNSIIGVCPIIKIAQQHFLVGKLTAQIRDLLEQKQIIPKSC